MSSSAAPTQEKKEKKPKQRIQALVKAVLSGDTLVLQTTTAAQQTAELTLTLSGITAPRLAGATQKRDEPFAWDSREYLRRRCIGQTVLAVVHSAPAAGRCFGSAFLAGDDLAHAVVMEGWAAVRQPLSEGVAARPETVALLAAETDARNAARGIHSKDAAARAHAVRPSAEALAASVTPLKFFEQNRGKEIRGVVEAIRTGSVLRVTFQPSFIVAQVSLAGIACPDVRWIVERREHQAEPFGMEAKQFVESHVLHRDVTVTITGIDKSNGFVGVVVALGHDLAEELLKLGLARMVGWGGIRETNPYNDKLAKAQSIAVAAKTGMWATDAPAIPSLVQQQQPQAAASASTSMDVEGKIVGRVVDIPTSGILVVEVGEGAQTKQIRMALASIRAPKIIREDGRDKAKEKDISRKQLFESMHATNGREALRKMLIGTQIACFKRYERPPVAPATEPSTYWDCYKTSGNTENVAVQLVAHGLVQIVQHKGSEPRSSDYDAFCLAEKRAEAKKLGLFADVDKTDVKRIRDISSNADQAREFLPFLVRQGEGDTPFEAVVEHVFSATRIKVYIPSQNCMIALCLQYVRPPPRGAAGDDGIAFLRSKIHLRDVMCRIVAIDKHGSFIGSVRMAGEKGEDLAVLLVQNGIVRLDEQSGGRRALPPHELRQAQEAAKTNKTGNWTRWLAAEEELARREEQQQQQTREVIEVVVCDFSRATPKSFWVQSVADISKLATMTAALTELAATPQQQQSQRLMRTPVVGTAVIAQFSEDEMWYRARVVAVHGARDVSVQYLDFGTVERVDLDRLQSLPHGYETATMPALAKRAELAHVVLPGEDSGLLGDYADMFTQLTEGVRLTASIEWTQNGVLFVGMACDAVHVNVVLVRDGIARAEKIRVQNPSKLHVAIAEAEETARRGRVGLWRYGDIDDDEDNF